MRKRVEMLGVFVGGVVGLIAAVVAGEAWLIRRRSTQVHGLADALEDVPPTYWRTRDPEAGRPSPRFPARGAGTPGDMARSIAFVEGLNGTAWPIDWEPDGAHGPRLVAQDPPDFRPEWMAHPDRTWVKRFAITRGYVSGKSTEGTDPGEPPSPVYVHGYDGSESVIEHPPGIPHWSIGLDRTGIQDRRRSPNLVGLGATDFHDGEDA